MEENQSAWICNECGFSDYTDAVSEEDLDNWLQCSNCGGDEFHLEPEQKICQKIIKTELTKEDAISYFEKRLENSPLCLLHVVDEVVHIGEDHDLPSVKIFERDEGNHYIGIFSNKWIHIGEDEYEYLREKSREIVQRLKEESDKLKFESVLKYINL